jgi:putative DNA primase/helicase
VVPNLWGVMIGPPGSKKSPVINEAKRFLQQFDRRWRLEYEQARQDYEAELAALKKAKPREQAAEEAEHQGPIEPRRRRALVNDATAEALHEVLAANPAGVLVLRDELPGWLGGLEKQGREGDRGLWLETWSGDGAYNSVRIARGATDADALCVSLFGGVQPGPWMEYAAKAPADGMLQRFQILVWPDPLPIIQLVDRAPNQGAEERMEAVFERLIEMAVEPPLRLRFTDDAQELHDEWLTKLEERIANGADRPAFTNHLSKYRSLMPALACTFELVENANAQSISLDAARRGAAFCDYLESHAERSYQARTDSVYQAARTLVTKIETGALGASGRFSLREAYRHGWMGLGTAAEARAACEVLTDYGWIRPLPVRPGNGRPPESFEVNPEVCG